MGTLYWSTCRCGWVSEKYLDDYRGADKAADLHFSAVLKFDEELDEPRGWIKAVDD